MSCRIRKTAIAVLLSLGVLSHASSSRLMAADVSLPDLLVQICEASDVKEFDWGYECTRATHYPSDATSSNACNIQISKIAYSGNFISGGNTLLLVGYSSDCENRATGGGGSLIYELTNGSYAFTSYAVGVVVDGCVKLATSPTRDRLFCLTGHMGQGFMETNVTEVVFARTVGGIAASMDIYASAEDSAGYYGANAVDCTSQDAILSFAALSHGPSADTLTIDAEYVDQSAVVHACSSGARRPADAISDPPAGQALVDPDRITSSKFVLALETRDLIRGDVFAALQTPEIATVAGESFPKPDAFTLGRRVALVIGNSEYAAVPALRNPVRDARAVSNTLHSLGFEDVMLAENLTKAEMEGELIRFADKAAGADWALIYYAGHGLEMDGQNYLIPIDATLTNDRHVRFETLPLDHVLEMADGAKALRLVILDACRNNPFAARMTRTAATRSIGRGLARVEPSGGTLVVYAARHGQVAEDGEGENSPFASALLQHINEPGLDVSVLFRRVRDTVLLMTNKAQEPFTYGSLPGDILSFRPDGSPGNE